MPKPSPAASASRLIDERIETLGDWRGEALARLRTMIREAVPDIAEEWKWQVPVWSSAGIVCTGETYKQTVKLTFAHGAKLDDPAKLFNSSLTGNTRRAIDIREGERLNARAFKALVKAAVAFNHAQKPAGKAKPAIAKPAVAKPAGAKPAVAKPKAAAAKKVVLLSGGNPQIAKGYGDAPVRDYIAAIPGWKRETAARLDALIERVVPGVQKAVKWNSAFYGKETGHWFLVFHVYTRYLKITFFRGTSLKPIPPEPSKSGDTRYAHLQEGEFDEAQLSAWVKQAAALPAEKL
jgi:hypothetical protein